MSYQDVRGADGRLLFRFDPERMLVEVVVRRQLYIVDLTTYMETTAAVVEFDPLGCGRTNQIRQASPRANNRWL